MAMMHALLLLVLGAASLAAAAASRPALLDVAVDSTDGSFNVSLGGTPWLVSKAPRLSTGGAWSIAGHNLTLLSSAPAPALQGFAAGTAWRWSSTGSSGDAVWETAIRKSSDGADAVLFSQTFLKDLPAGHHADISPPCPNITRGNVPSGCAAPAKPGSRVAITEVALAEFPSVRVVQGGPTLGAFCGAGMSDGPRLYTFNNPSYDASSDTNMVADWGSGAGGPTALFDDSPERKTLVISPAGENILSSICERFCHGSAKQAGAVPLPSSHLLYSHDPAL
jgi:hypothetical protein